MWGTETYGYDPLNNLRSRKLGSQTTTYHYDSQNPVRVNVRPNSYLGFYL